MNWAKVLVGGIVGGLVLMIASFVMHGLIMGETYTRYPEVFTQEQSGIGWFVLVSVVIGITVAILFAKTRGSFAAGARGGVVFGALVGLTQYFPNFYDALVFAGFPYFLSWCHGGMDFIGYTLAGAAMGAVMKTPADAQRPAR